VVKLSGLVEKKLACGEKGKLGEKEARNCMTGNLCRCTGYQPILDAATRIDLSRCESVKDKYWSSSQEKELKKALAKPVELNSERFSFFAPTALSEATKYLAKEKDVRILASGTDLGVVHNKGKIQLNKILSLHLIPSLYELKVAGGSVRVGARVTLAELREALKDSAPELARYLDIFASPQIKNIATLIGNVANASPIANTPPFLLTYEAVVEIVGPRAKRKLPLKDFYLGYRKTALKRGELVTAIEFEIPGESDQWAVYKVSERKDLDISSVNAGFRIVRDKKGSVKKAIVAFGGVAATPVRLPRTEKYLASGSAELTRAQVLLQEEIAPISDVRGSSAFRRVLASNLMEKFFRERIK
jgi:xanthine dehydrogenase small subunit